MGKIKMSDLPFAGTAEQETQLMGVIAEHKGTPGALMPVLQKAQGIYGYLPIEVQRMISGGLDMPLEEVFGVVTFYSQFSLVPKGEYKIGVCMGTACYVKGAGDLLDRLKEALKIDSGQCTKDGKFSLDATRCIGCCGLAPVITVNEDVYGKLASADIAKIVAKYRA